MGSEVDEGVDPPALRFQCRWVVGREEFVEDVIARNPATFAHRARPSPRLIVDFFDAQYHSAKTCKTTT